MYYNNDYTDSWHGKCESGKKAALWSCFRILSISFVNLTNTFLIFTFPQFICSFSYHFLIINCNNWHPFRFYEYHQERCVFVLSIFKRKMIILTHDILKLHLVLINSQKNVYLWVHSIIYIFKEKIYTIFIFYEIYL